MKKPSKKVVLSVLFSVLFIGLVFGGYKGLEATNHFFSLNELRFNKMIDVKFKKPIEIVSKKQIQEEVEFNAKVEKVSNDAVDRFLFGEYGLEANPTTTPKKEQSGLVKEVQAAGNYTYQNYSKRPYYSVVLEGLKKRYVNWEDAAELEAREGGFDPGAINPTSGACGLPQALPCKKMGCSLTDIDCQLDWMKGYIGDRYGTVENALKFRIVNNWY